MEVDKIKDDLRGLSKRIISLESNIKNEEQTKNAFIMPFFQILGYDVFNPLEFVPEFTADVGIKKGEKVDYAIMIDETPQILIECKSINENLTKHDSQLFRYFGTTTSKFGILTNGKEYRFFTDLEETNKMDSTPFLTVDITNIKENQLTELIKFHKQTFDIDKITSSASELKYLGFLKSYLNKNLTSPTETFLKFLVSEIYEGVKTKSVLEEFRPIITKGFSQFITEKVNEKLSAALNTNVETKELTEESSADEKTIVNDIITTSEELEAYTVVKMLLKDTIEPSRIFYRDNKSYFNVLLDDSIRKWILRFRQVGSKTTIQLNDENKTVYEIQTALDISSYKNEIIAVVSSYI
jgi:hypothetical protein